MTKDLETPTGENNDFNLFTHLRQDGVEVQENYITLKEAILELYLSVKIRSDEEIDNYTEEQFRIEKEQMKEVYGFTLIDYIKSSIEILMNMKIEENDGSSSVEIKEKKKIKGKKQKVNDDLGNNIPKIDDRTPTSSIMNLQKKLDQISSPESSVSESSIPAAHKEYEKILRQLESECRNHIKVEQQMKLHIECLQEKIESANKERDSFKK